MRAQRGKTTKIMAKLTKGLFGNISGKVGNMVFVTRNDKCYVKSLPKRSVMPPTEKQLIQREKFGMVMRFLSPVSSLINDSYRSINKKKMGVNVAVQQIMADAIIGQYPNLGLDFQKIGLIRGRLNNPHGVLSQESGSGKLTFTWPVQIQFNANASDELLIMIYCDALAKFWYNLDLRFQRWEGTCSVKLPPAFAGKNLQVWLAYRSAGGKAFSNSEYLGEVMIKKPR